MFGWALLAAGVLLTATPSVVAARAEILIGVAGPMTGAYAWFGEQYQRGAGLAVEDLNAAGGVLGQQVRLITADDFCDPEQAVAAARKLVGDGVAIVVGHWCSHSAIPASKVYEEAEILMIAPGAISSKLTDEGGPYVFRVCGRDDKQGAKVADYLAEHWAGKKIAILDDGTTFGTGLANGARRRLREHGIRLAIDESYSPAEVSFAALVSKMEAAGVNVLFVGGYHREAGLIFREARERGLDLTLIAHSAMATADFPLITGPGLGGTLMVAAADMRTNPRAAEVVARLRAQGYDPPGFTLYAYAAVQVWAQAAEAAGHLDPKRVIPVMHSRRFDTVLGRIGFDAQGDVTGFEPWSWYVWQADGTYMPLERSAARREVDQRVVR